MKNYLKQRCLFCNNEEQHYRLKNRLYCKCLIEPFFKSMNALPLDQQEILANVEDIKIVIVNGKLEDEYFVNGHWHNRTNVLEILK